MEHPSPDPTKAINSLEKACKVANISQGSYSKRKQVIEYGDPTIISKMENDEISINEAYREIKRKRRRRTNKKGG